MPGKLILVATPIGNLGDVSARAREALAEADLIACEDTRRAAKLLSHLGLEKPLEIYAGHNEAGAATKIGRRLDRGDVVAVVSDGGTPLLADPGYVILQQALAAGAEVDFIPGPSAVHAALALSGLPPYPYAFLGYLPRKRPERRKFLERYASLPATAVLFVTPHRLAAELADVREGWGDRAAALAREMTKIHQEVIRGTLAELAATAKTARFKGELTLVVAAGEAAGDVTAARRLARELREEGLTAGRAAAVAARTFGVPKRDVYGSAD
ncbi:MAG: 16S rRNA (cytidine(1402)-2'-O)-methyltransferase [Candidatus Zixiibacteriota bacterium]|jgi:16S rRNA (cytidine1402-2'-O)-methyltransferase